MTKSHIAVIYQLKLLQLTNVVLKRKQTMKYDFNRTVCVHPDTQTCGICTYDAVVVRAHSRGEQPSYSELARVLEMAIRRTDYHEARLALDDFGREFTEQELERMISIRIKRGQYGLACHAARVADRELTQAEIDEVVAIGLRIHNDVGDVLHAVHQDKVSPNGINQLIDICLDKLMPNTAGALAKINSSRSFLRIYIYILRSDPITQKYAICSGVACWTANICNHIKENSCARSFLINKHDIVRP